MTSSFIDMHSTPLNPKLYSKSVKKMKVGEIVRSSSQVQTALDHCDKRHTDKTIFWSRY